MNSITIDPLLLEYGLPALGLGLLLGALISWTFYRRRTARHGGADKEPGVHSEGAGNRL